ncbi:hypothetical protein GO730_09610 [Spirosoma sp. HMF3257]|uniref:Glycosyltransferase RgtA/B/C/D-like domain-containing protein n=1 Tax=Spirosoma telluris TaxID=2183553 RepID=A0A327NGF8_9BACT|nr:hypothetical protein [Spirosoma telluris]RAI74450.1 hypothetical protein HMF3257_09515 [Spirosoma telluris]
MNQSRFLWVAYVGLGAVMTVLILLNPGRFMSVDSHYYLRSATNLLAGRGYVILEQGQWIWNGTFPIGYPALIAILSGLTGLPILVASKVVNYAAIGMSGYGWVRRLGAARAIWPLSIWGLGGFLKIAVYTWSETIFLVLLAEWVWGLYQFLQNPNATRTFSLFLLGYGLFLIRYVGGFVFGLTSLLALTSWLVPIWFQAKAEPSLSPTISRKFLVIAVAGFAGMGMYFWMNQRLSGSLFGESDLFQRNLPGSLSNFSVGRC